MFVSLLWNSYQAGHIRIVGIVVGGFDYFIWSFWNMFFDDDGFLIEWMMQCWIGF